MKWRRKRKVIAVVLALLGGVALLQYANAQSGGSITLSTPVAFPVDI